MTKIGERRKGNEEWKGWDKEEGRERVKRGKE